MKQFFLLSTIITVFFLVGCEKESEDFRNRYIGDWSFSIERIEHNTDSIGYYYQDTIKYVGKIFEGNSENEIRINYMFSNSLALIIDEDGTLSNFPTKYCNGEFEGNNKIHLYLRWGGLGGSTTHIVDGIMK